MKGEILILNKEKVEGWIFEENNTEIKVSIYIGNKLLGIVPANMNSYFLKNRNIATGFNKFIFKFPEELTKIELLDITCKVGNFLIKNGLNKKIIDETQDDLSSKVNFFIVGAPKCGTSFFYEYLKRHPDIFLPEIKEPNHFADDLGIIAFNKYNVYSSYKSLYTNISNYKQISGDCSQFHLYSSVAASRIFTYNSSAKIIILLREPITLMKSLYNQYRKTKDESCQSFENALLAIVSKNRDTPLSLYPNCMDYLDIGLLSVQAKRYLDVFPRKNILFIRFDELQKKANGVINKITNFLEVSSFAKEMQFEKINVSKSIYETPNLSSDYTKEHVLILIEKLKEIRLDINNLEKYTQMDLSTWKLECESQIIGILEKINNND